MNLGKLVIYNSRQQIYSTLPTIVLQNKWDSLSSLQADNLAWLSPSKWGTQRKSKKRLNYLTTPLVAKSLSKTSRSSALSVGQKTFTVKTKIRNDTTCKRHRKCGLQMLIALSAGQKRNETENLFNYSMLFFLLLTLGKILLVSYISVWVQYKCKGRIMLRSC